MTSLPLTWLRSDWRQRSGISPSADYNAVRIHELAIRLRAQRGAFRGKVNMKKEELRARVEEVGIAPVIRTSSADDARFAVQEFAHGGIPLFSATLTPPAPLQPIPA